jgi:hypothetical protein
MSVGYTVEQRDAYTVVRVQGDPSLEEFIAFVEAMGEESRNWPRRRALFDLRNVRTLKSFTEHYAIGGAVVTHLHHMERVASVVPADRITRASEKRARQSGVNLSVFTSAGEAIDWLEAGAPGEHGES